MEIKTSPLLLLSLSVETNYLTSVTPFLLVSFNRDVQLNGYTIPKDTQVVPLLHAVHMDPDLWESPEKFMPTRFLNSEGKVTKPEYFLPFGVGKCFTIIYAAL